MTDKQLKEEMKEAVTQTVHSKRPEFIEAAKGVAIRAYLAHAGRESRLPYSRALYRSQLPRVAAAERQRGCRAGSDPLVRSSLLRCQEDAESVGRGKVRVSK